MPLNDLQIKRSKPDENGLYLYITPAGGKSFRFDYAMNGKRATLTIGKYPAVSLLFPRSTEFRGGKWQEIDFQAAIWTIPAERMKHEKNKPKPPLVIPLSTWTIELLHELRELTGNTPYLFPSRTAQNGVMSETTLNNIIKKLGYNGIATPHGFRSLASSLLNEQGFNPDAIERQLAHIPHDKIRATYNRAEYMAERTEFMQWYSDYLKRNRAKHFRQPC